MKALNTECWDPVLLAFYCKCVCKIPQWKQNQPISDDFSKPQKQTTHTKQRNRYSLVTCTLVDFSVGLSVWEWVYSLNHETILCIKECKIGFLGEN